MLGEWRDGKYYVEGLEYKFPSKPSVKTILNNNLPKKYQKWKRIEDYENFDWTRGWEERINDNPDQIQYLVDEFDRLRNGLWLYINGEAVYLNNYMYFFVQWYLLPDTGEYPEYRDTSLYYFRFLEIVEKSFVATGDTLIKARRLGATSMIIAKMLLKMLLSERKNFGITSKSGQDAGMEGAYGFLIAAFDSLPIFLKPEIEGGDTTKTVLSFKNKPKGSKTNDSSGLLVKAFWRSPGMNTFDSGAYEEILIDETGKFDSKKTKVDIRDYLPVVTKCVKKGAKITGKLHLPTTVNPPEDGGDNYKQIWRDSDQSKADYLGKTVSGLYRIFISAAYGFGGYIDEFGNSVVNTPTAEQTEFLKSLGEGVCPDPLIGAKEFLQNERAKLKNRPADLQKEIQMNPFTAEEVFENANDTCIFNLNDLTVRQRELEEDLDILGLDIEIGELGRRGSFLKGLNGRVYFTDDDNGLWYVHKLLEDNESNKFEIVNGKQIPTNEIFGAGGLDPIAAGDATVDKGSDACCIIRERYSSMNPDESGLPVAMLIGRMHDIEKLNEQIFNGLIYYGVKVLAERAPVNWLQYAINHKLDEYCYGTKRSDGTEVKGIQQQSQALIDEHAEVQVLSSLTDWSKIKFVRLNRDRINFKVKKRTDYDACMADGYALMALRTPLKKEKSKPKELKFLMKGRILN